MFLTQFLEQNPAIFHLFCALIGLSIGSFLNVVIYRLPIMLEREWNSQCREMLELEQPTEERFNLSHPASRCPHCSHKIRFWENIPVISYLMLRGQCSGCQQKISPRYPVIEAVTGLLSLMVALHFGVGLQTVAALLLTWTLIALTMIDYDHQILPDNIVLPVLWLGLLINLLGVFTSPQEAIIGATAGYISLWGVFQLFRLITGKEGMGYGDFKLFALFGAWLGWQSLFQIILLSSLVGAVVGVAMILFLGRDKSLPIPFGPYLAAAGWISLMWGDQINRLYLNWAGL